MLQPRSLHLVHRVKRRGLLGRSTTLLGIVDEMAARPVWAETDGVEGAAQLSFVLRMAAQAAQFMDSVSKLAFVAIFAGTVLLKGPAELCLVTAGVHLAAATGGTGRAQALVDEPLARLGVGAVSQAVLLVVAGIANP